MSTDETYETQLHQAIAQVMSLPRPKMREQILKNAVFVIMHTMGWPALVLTQTGAKIGPLTCRLCGFTEGAGSKDQQHFVEPDLCNACQQKAAV